MIGPKSIHVDRLISVSREEKKKTLSLHVLYRCTSRLEIKDEALVNP